MAMISLTCKLRKTKPAHILTNKSKLNRLLYIDDLTLFAKSQNGIQSLIHAATNFSNPDVMELRLDKCATVKMKLGKLVEMERAVLVEANTMLAMKEDRECKFLGMLEMDDFKHKKMRENREETLQ